MVIEIIMEIATEWQMSLTMKSVDLQCAKAGDIVGHDINADAFMLAGGI